jgi:hypothetical protein
MVTTIVHELAHAMLAYALGVRSTLFSYFVDLELTPAQAANYQGAIIGVAGPLIGLLLGMFAWLAFRRVRDSGAGLPLVYFTIFGVGTFFGNLMSIAFIGDFSAVARTLGLPMGVRYALAGIGALSTAAIHLWGGRTLAHWAPTGAGRVRSMVGVVALPVVLGMALVMVANQPMPSTFAAARLGEASLWLIAAAGALVAGQQSRNGNLDLQVRWFDCAVVLFALLVVRLLVPGVPLTP